MQNNSCLINRPWQREAAGMVGHTADLCADDLGDQIGEQAMAETFTPATEASFRTLPSNDGTRMPANCIRAIFASFGPGCVPIARR